MSAMSPEEMRLVLLQQHQMEREKQASGAGVERFRARMQAAKTNGTLDATAVGKDLVAYRVSALAETIKQWQDEANNGKAGRKQTAALLIGTFDPAVLAFLTLRATVGGLSFGDKRKLTGIAAQLGQKIEDEMRLRAFKASPEGKGRRTSRIVEDANARVSYGYKHNFVQRKLGRLKDGWDAWTTDQRIHVGTRLIDMVAETMPELIRLEMIQVGKKRNHIIVPQPALLEWIEKRSSTLEALNPLREPMVCPPLRWEGMNGGGYLTEFIPAYSLVQSYQSLSAEEHATLAAALEASPHVLRAINALQEVPYGINKGVLAVAKTLWEMELEIAGLPTRESTEVPPSPADAATNPEALLTWKRMAAAIHSRNGTMMGKRISVANTLAQAQDFAKYDAIYMPYQLDFRGRIYAVPSLSPQGNDLQKALLQHATGKPIGVEGIRWLAIHGANVAGVDKVSFDDRVKWIKENEQEIRAIGADPHSNRGWAGSVGEQEIDKPFQFLAFCLEWAGVCLEGPRFVSRLFVALDGSCSGLQHFSAALRDQRGGAAVNLVPASKPADVYQEVANVVTVTVAADAASGTPDEVKVVDDVTIVVEGTKTLAAQWQAFGINRKTTKRPVMTLAYGATRIGFSDQIKEDTVEPALFAARAVDGTVDTSKFPFTQTGGPATKYMAQAVWEATSVTLSKAVAAMDWLKDPARRLAMIGMGVKWTTPSGFVVIQRNPKTQESLINTFLNGKTRQVTYRKQVPGVDPKKAVSSVAPNFVHSLDASHMVLTINGCQDSGVTDFAMIHDSFGSLAADTEVMARTVREQFVKMYTDNDVFQQFYVEVCAQLGDEAAEIPAPPEKGTLDLRGVMQSSYCFA